MGHTVWLHQEIKLKFSISLRSRIGQAGQTLTKIMCNLLLSSSLIELIMTFLSPELDVTILGQSTVGKMSNPLFVALESALIVFLQMAESAGNFISKFKKVFS